MSAPAIAQPDRTHEVTSFFEHAEWTGATSDNTELWLEQRRQMVTASDVAAIMGEDDYNNRTPYAVYVDKVCEPKKEKLGLNDARLWGLKLERPILEIVADFHGWKFRPSGALLRSRKYPFIGATLDAEVDRGDGWVPYEGKTTRIPQGWNEEEGMLPTRVLIQTQTQLLVTGAPVNVVFALLQGSRPCQVDVYPSPEFHEIIVEACEAFLKRVRDLDPPPPMPGKSERESFLRMHPNEDGSIVRLTPEAVEWTREYQKIGKELKALNDQREHISDLLRASMGDALWGTLPIDVGGKTVWRLQKEDRAAYSVAASSTRKLLAMKAIT